MDKQVNCPNCGRSTVTEESKTRKRKPVELIVMIVVGVALVFIGYRFLRDTSWLMYICIAFGLWLIWDSVTGLPLPLLSIKLIDEPMIYRYRCRSCQHRWDVDTSEIKKEIEAPPSDKQESQ